MEVDTVNWTLLERLRTEFLNARGNTGVYWQSREDLEHYHRFFAARIGWKWEDALAQAKQAGWQLRTERVFDWGCGSGIASLTLLESIEAGAIREVILWDHSSLACEFAREVIATRFPEVSVTIATIDSFPSLEGIAVIASHVLNELSLDARAELTRRFRSADQCFWVEPGSYDSSRLLMEQREALLNDFTPVAPCVCSQPCPMSREENARHWCHFFAKAPVEAFTSGDWARFGKIMGIDLRSLPYSFIAMDSKRLPPIAATEGLSRVLGRPRQFKGYTRIYSCDANGHHDYELQKRDDKSLWKAIKKGKSGSLYQWTEIVDDRIHAGKPVD